MSTARGGKEFYLFRQDLLATGKGRDGNAADEESSNEVRQFPLLWPYLFMVRAQQILRHIHEPLHG